jgi:hypothetical protein
MRKGAAAAKGPFFYRNLRNDRYSLTNPPTPQPLQPSVANVL